jgi:hypothetical protein
MKDEITECSFLLINHVQPGGTSNYILLHCLQIDEK